MSKLEMVRRLDDTGQQRETVRTIADLQHQIERLQDLPDQVRHSLMLMQQETSATAERMATAIEPLAQAMARWTRPGKSPLALLWATYSSTAAWRWTFFRRAIS